MRRPHHFAEDRSSPTDFLRVACTIGDELTATALWHDGQCAWTGDDIVDHSGKWELEHRPIDCGVYSGVAGIARFLAYLWQSTGNPHYRRTVFGAMERSFKGASDDGPSFWTGGTGIACVALEIGKILNDGHLHETGLNIARKVVDDELPKLLASACPLDAISGLAGIIPGLAHIARETGENPGGCQSAVERIIAAARKLPIGWSWPMHEEDINSPHLLGIAHGAAGFALALAEANSLFPSPTLREAISQTLAYENSWFDPNASGWPDIRTDDSAIGPAASNFGVSPYWCHGAAGIGMARLRMYELSGDPRTIADATAALNAVKTACASIIGTGSLYGDTNFSVCHGAGSLIELLLYANALLPSSDALNWAHSLARAGIHRTSLRNGKWQCGVPQNGEHPGLMLGLAGIGMSYLALVDPRTPLVTLLRSARVRNDSSAQPEFPARPRQHLDAISALPPRAHR